MQLVISDAHTGLISAIGAVLIGAARQRRRVHFMRNVLTKIPRASGDGRRRDPRDLRSTRTGPCRNPVRRDHHHAQPPVRGCCRLLTDARADLLAFSSFPAAHWKKIWSTNPIERVHKEMKRRTNVVGIFPNDAALLRRVTAVIAEAHGEWRVCDHHYLSEGSMNKLYRPTRPR